VNIVQITPGAGDNFYCENCLRDGGQLRALRRGGHDVLGVPLYLPPLAEGRGGAPVSRIFFGGINVYLQQKLSLFRHTPRWLDRMWDSPRLLRWLARRAGATDAADLGRTTVSMLRGENGRQVKELQRLIDFLSEQDRPDIVCLSNALLLGLAGPIRRALKTRVVCMLQDEDGFLDNLPRPYREHAWAHLRDCLDQTDAIVAPSRYYADAMASRLDLAGEDIHIIPNGIDVQGYAPSEGSGPPTIGYLAPMTPGKGTDMLLDAFELLKRRGDRPGVRLQLAGGFPAEAKAFHRRMLRRIRRSAFAADIDVLDDFDRPAKQRFLPALSVLSVPSRQPEAFGLFALEAWACGVPVVLPRHGAFTELVETTGGGVLFEPGNVTDLAENLAGVLKDDVRRRDLGERGRRAVASTFTVDHVATRLTELYQTLIDRETA